MGYIFSIRHVILEFPVFIYVSKLPLNITCFADFNGDLCRYVTTEPQYTRAFHPEKRDEFLVSLVATRIPLYLTHSLSFFRCQLSVHENKEQQQQQLGILLVFEQTARRAAPRGAREQSGASSLVEGRPPAVATRGLLLRSSSNSSGDSTRHCGTPQADWEQWRYAMPALIHTSGAPLVLNANANSRRERPLTTLRHYPLSLWLCSVKAL